MPAPRSILIDIHDRGLNPKVAHKSVDSSGRIKADAAPEQEQIPDKPKLALKKLTKEVKTKDETVVASGEPTTEEVTNEGVGSVELSQQEETVVAPPVTTRRNKRHTPNNA